MVYSVILFEVDFTILCRILLCFDCQQFGVLCPEIVLVMGNGYSQFPFFLFRLAAFLVRTLE